MCILLFIQKHTKEVFFKFNFMYAHQISEKSVYRQLVLSKLTTRSFFYLFSMKLKRIEVNSYLCLCSYKDSHKLMQPDFESFKLHIYLMTCLFYQRL